MGQYDDGQYPLYLMNIPVGIIFEDSITAHICCVRGFFCDCLEISPVYQLMVLFI